MGYYKYVVAYNCFTKRCTIAYIGSEFDKMLYGDDMGVAFTAYECNYWTEVENNIKIAMEREFTVYNDINGKFYYHPYYEGISELIK